LGRRGEGKNENWVKWVTEERIQKNTKRGAKINLLSEGRSLHHKLNKKGF